MLDIHFFETVMDNLEDGVYVLDDSGNYLFVNNTYTKILNIPKKTLLSYNVHDFISTGQIDYCISDIVYREKRQIVMFQDVQDTKNLFNRENYRQIVISTPIFDEKGQITNIIAVVRPVDRQNEVYRQASESSYSSLVIRGRSEGYKKGSIIAESAPMKRILATAEMVAEVDAPVLITGDSGTGKEVIANFIHKMSPRGKKEIVIVNCASLPEPLLEAELFGYEKGAFTGALSTGKRGLFEEADGSTLMLDEINSLPVSLQGKILRAIETKMIRRVGSNERRKVDFRLISATNEDLEKMVEEKRFRADLFYRLAVIPLHLPALKDRAEDILPMADYFLKMYCEKYAKEKTFTEQTRKVIAAYDWPGNVRELKNFVERAVVMSRGTEVEILDVSSLIEDRPRPEKRQYSSIDRENRFESLLNAGVSLDDYLAECEKQYLSYAFQRYQNTYRVAEALGTSQSSIMRRKKKYDFDPKTSGQ
ncbi:MAG: sigma 54-interacting transcriptional regulator [Clostridia bacterium]|nr:sigma 54-interacting transcriptional regulator [Clostridia bacterium]